MLNRYKYLIFDLDGTLLDTDLYVASNYAHLYEKYRPGYMPRLSELIYFSGPTLDEVFAREFPNVDQNELYAEFADFSDRYSNLYATLYEGEKDCLDALRQKGYKMSVCTSKREHAVISNLGHFGLLKYFDHLVGYDSVKAHKPDPEGIKKCLVLYGASARETLYIGDSETDLVAGLNAGVDVALVTWGLKRLPAEPKPTYCFDSFRRIKESL